MKAPIHKPLVVLFTLAYCMSWLVWLPLYLPAFGITSLPALPYQHAFGGLGPMVAAFTAALIFCKRDGVVRLLRQCLNVRPLL